MTQQRIPKQSTLDSQKLNIDWQQVCQAIWKNSLSINPLTTQPKETEAQQEEIYLSLGLIEQNKLKYPQDYSIGETDEQPDNPHPEEIIGKYSQKEFCEQVLSLGKSKTKGRRLAIIGESSTGKTTILNQIVAWILDNTDDLPIWISMAEIGETPLHQYLQEKWLRRVAKTQDELTQKWQNSLEELLNSGRVWLLLDGVEQMPSEQIEKLPITLNCEKHLRWFLSPLSATIQQLQGWADKTRVILTSRSEVFSLDKKTLSNFDVFCPLELTYPEEVKQFISYWFFHNSPSKIASQSSKKFANHSQKSEKLAEQLFQTIDQFGYYRIQKLVQTPLRLSLLCRQMQQNKGILPTTLAKLYEQLVAQYYQWQAQTALLNSQQQQQLNQALGKLAVQAMYSDRHPRWLHHYQITQELGKDDTLLKLALRLGWLRAIGITLENKQTIYTFWDETFQAYFAATAIDNWQFFLNHLSISSLPSTESESSYRIFEPRWKRVILLWLGRENLKKEDKEAFLQSLVEFADGCETENFYGKRAYFLASSGLAEFPESQQTKEILLELLQWSFFDAQVSPLIAQAAKSALRQTNRQWAIPALIQLLTTIKNETIKREVFKSLEKIGRGNPQVLAALTEMLQTTSSNLQLQVAESLGKIDPGNRNAIATILNLLKTASNEETRQIAFNTLEKIGKGNFKAITTLIQLLQTTDSPTTQRRAYSTIETIGYGNTIAIAALAQLIRTNSDEGIRRQAAESLEKIDSGNPMAITVLVKLINTASNEEIQKQAVYSIGEITPGNSQAIDALIKILSPNNSIFLRWMAVSSLGKVGIGNQKAIDALITLIQSDEQKLLRKDAIESLNKIDPHNQEAITALVKLMESSNDESSRREAAESLGKIDPGNPEAIAALVQLLHTTSDEFTCREAAYSLGKIDPGNLEALKTLIQLIQKDAEPNVRSLAAESLGEIGIKNPAAIAALIRLTKTTNDPKTLRRVAVSLGKIGRGNREVISALVQMLKSAQEESCRLQVADSLINLLIKEEMSEVVASLKEILSEPQKRKDLACQKIIWHCAQQLSYPDFYQAWHNRPRYGTQKPSRDGNGYNGENPTPVDGTQCADAGSEPVPPLLGETARPDLLPNALPQLVRDPNQAKSQSAEEKISEPSSSENLKPTWKNLSQLLQRKINEHSQLSQIRLVCIDSNDLLDPENPFVDIYDLMLAQKCPAFEYGIPDTMAKLRLYWNTIQRNNKNAIFVLIFWENLAELDSQGFFPVFLKMLNKFPGAICLVTEQPDSKLQQFSPSDPELIENIINWIKKFLCIITLE